MALNQAAGEIEDLRPGSFEISPVRVADPVPGRIRTILPGLVSFESTCTAYAILDGDDAVLVDLGDGSVLDHLAELGIRRVTDVLFTHHHRDQAQGLPRAVADGCRIWVPEAEQDLFTRVEAHRMGRDPANNYNVREDRFSILHSIPGCQLLRDYERISLGSLELTVLPTPGHTPGSISLLAEIADRKIAFTGDLIAGPGKIWSLAATQWTYNGAEGAAATILSMDSLREHSPDLLLPSHGSAMADPEDAIRQLSAGLTDLLELRGQYGWLAGQAASPYLPITPHLLHNRTSVSDSYVLLADSGKALLIDYGYDFQTGFPAGTDRAARRPWLYTLPALKRQYGVTRIDVAIPTHPHDDHVAGMNLLRRVEGTQVWAAEIAVPVLENPARHNLPCLWYDPIPVDRALPFHVPIRWEEYRIALYPLPGHSLYAAAIYFEVDGKRVLATGDQYQGGDGHLLNYVYQNRFNAGDFIASAGLYRRLSPDLLLTGHWGAQPLTAEYLELLETQGEAIARLHRNLLPDELAGLGGEGFAARLEPYRAQACPGETLVYTAEITNPSPDPVLARVSLSIPTGWRAEPDEAVLSLAGAERRAVSFNLAIPNSAEAGTEWIAVRFSTVEHDFGQQAEAEIRLVDPARTRIG